jgi:serine/threonine-protein kinase
MEDVASHGRASCPTCRAVFRGGFLRCPHDGALLSSADVDPLVGTVLAERYQIESVIGEGGIGRVYRARHVRMSRRYAIKVPFGELAYDQKVRARFLQEAEATSRLQHPNVIGVVDVGETEAGLLYMAMDLAEGVSLAEVIQDGPMTPLRTLRIVEQIADGLGHAHERGLVHRDLKPENIILEPDGIGGDRARIVDFGIAILRDADGNSGRLTTEGIVLGTPHYMSPEQACNLEIDHRTDLFALGLILYEMLAGVLPFDGSPVEVARKNLGADPPRITARVPGLVVDRHLQALAFWLMEKKPEARPQRAAEVVEVLRLIETDPHAASARLHIGELEEVEELGVAPKGAIRPRAPLPPRIGPPVRTTPAPGVPITAPPAEAQVELHDELPLATERTGEPRRRVFTIALILALAAALIVIVALLRGGGEPEPQARAEVAPDAAPPVVVTAPPDAGVALAVADAAVEQAPPDAAVATGPVKKKDPIVRKKEPRPDAGVATIDPPKDDPPTRASFTDLYDRVGRQLNQVIAAKGKASTVTFAKRYSDIPYLEAIRKPDLRKEAMSALRALSRDLARAN